MATRLERIRNWAELARQCAYSAACIATKCGITLRHLERFFRAKFGLGPNEWLMELRQAHGVELLNRGLPVKEVANQLGYIYPCHFSRYFKAWYGKPPSQYMPGQRGQRRDLWG